MDAKRHAECQWETGAFSLTYRLAVGLETLEERHVRQEHPARPDCWTQQAIVQVLAAPGGCNEKNVSLSFVHLSVGS